MITAAVYADASGRIVSATVDGYTWAHVDLDGDGEIPERLRAWIAAGQAPAPYAAPAPPVPAITKRQVLLWLLAGGKTEADVLAAIAAIADPDQRERVRIAWLYPDRPFEHSNPNVIALGAALGVSGEVLAEAFRAAAAL